MPITANATWREVTSQIVHDPAYKDLAHLPIAAWQPITVIVLAYAAFAWSTWAYIAGYTPLLLTVFLSSIAVYASFTPLHDATHRALSRQPWLNDFLGTISGQLIFPGATTKLYRTLHLTHHRFAGDKVRDPDEYLASVKGSKVLPTIMFTDLVWTLWYYRQGRKLLPKEFFWQYTLFVIRYLAIAAIGLMSPYWLEFTMLYLIPQRIGLAITVYFLAHIQHPEDATFEQHPFQTTVYLPTGFIQKVLMLGQADHHIHHLLPNLPFYRYAHIWKLANGALHKQAIPEGSFWRKATPELKTNTEATRLPAVITALETVGQDIKRLTLSAPQGAELPRFTAGSHVAVELPSGIVRHYSLCHDPEVTGQYQIAVKRDEQGRGGSKEVHELKVGTTLKISPPKNNFLLYEAATRYKLISGGIGITPLLSMAHRLTSLRKPFELHVCAKTEADVPFQSELGNLPFADKVETHLDQNSGGSSLDPSRAIGPYQSGTQLYICGPAGFMSWIKTGALSLGWPPEAILIESFTSPITHQEETQSFSVRLAKRNISFEVPADKAIIDILPDLGVPVKVSCMQGVCGTCITPVLEGDIDHRDATLSDSERASNQMMCVCVSRAKGNEPLVLDI